MPDRITGLAQPVSIGQDWSLLSQGGNTGTSIALKLNLIRESDRGGRCADCYCCGRSYGGWCACVMSAEVLFGVQYDGARRAYVEVEVWVSEHDAGLLADRVAYR